MQYTRLVVIAFLFAIPLAWYTMHKWLEIFAYKTRIGLWPILISGFLALFVAWITVSYHSFRASRANPVNSLRSE